MSLVLSGSTSGSVTLQEPAIAGTTVLDLPAVSGTVGLVSGNLGTPSTLVGTNITGTANSLNAGLGVNQTWQNVTVSRVSGTTYTNSTGKPIFVSIQAVPSTSGGNYVEVFINGVTRGYFGQGSGVSPSTVYSSFWNVIVPSGDTYKATIVGNISIDYWFELR
jgi:hypothetical protein